MPRRDEDLISGAKVSLLQKPAEWVARLVDLGATRQEIEETIEKMIQGVQQELEISLSRREEKRLVEEAGD